jgi:hypothetical protein
MGKTYKNRAAVKGKKSKKQYQEFDENYNASLKYEKREKARDEKLNINWTKLVS